MPQWDRQVIRRILLVKLSSLGDIIHSTACLAPLRRTFPDASITMVVEKRFAAAVRYNPHLDHLIEVERTGALGRLLPAVAFHLNARGDAFDLAIDLQGKFHSALWVYGSHAAEMAGFGQWRPGWNARAIDLRQHAVRDLSCLMQDLGVRMKDPRPEIFLLPTAIDRVRRILEEAGLKRRGFLLVNPFSRVATRHWTEDRMAELIRRVRKRFGLPVVLMGAEYQRRQSQSLMVKVGEPQCLSWIGRTLLEEAFCLIRDARILVSVDSGPVHAAAALGTPVVALFGPSLPQRTGPWGEGHEVVQNRVPPSHRAYRRDWRRTYMQSIGVDEVFRAVEKILACE